MFAALNKKLQEKKSRSKKKTFKQPIRRPRKKKQTVLLKPNVERLKPIIKPKKVKGSYTNWFTHALWPFIYNVVKNIVISQRDAIFLGQLIEK